MDRPKGIPLIDKAYVRTSHGQLHIRRCGERPSIVMLQILPFGCAMLEPLMGALAAAGRASLAIDLMGYGGSDPRPEKWAVEDFARNVIEAFERLELGPDLLLAGHFGALVATEIALTTPQLAPRLALDGVPAWSDDERAERAQANKGSSPLDVAGEAVLARWTRTVGVLQRADPGHPVGPGSEAGYLEAYRGFLALDHKPGPEGAFFGYGTEASLRSLAVPVLVLGSPTDTLRPFHDRALAWIPKSRGHVFDGVNPIYYMTRNAPADQLSEYVDVLCDFLGSTEATPAEPTTRPDDNQS